MRAFVDDGPPPVRSAICDRLQAARLAEAGNRPAEARAHLHAAIDLDGTPRSHLALVRFLVEHQEDHQAALDSLIRAWQISQAAGHRGWQAICCRLLQAACSNCGDLLAASQFRQLAISAWCDTLRDGPEQQTVSLEILRDAAALAAHWEHWDMAAGWLAEGLPNADHADRGEWEINLGAAYLRLGRAADGRRHLLRGFVASRHEGDFAGCGHALLTLGHGDVAQQNWSRAGRAFRVAGRWFHRASLTTEARRCRDFAREAARLAALQTCDPLRN